MQEELKYIDDLDGNNPSLDPDKLFLTLRNLFPWLMLILVGVITAAYLFIRYTKPIYESKSVLKLDIKNEAMVFGVTTMEEDQNYKNLSTEIELLKSRLFISKLIKVLQLQVTVYTIGNILVDERYNNAPFEVYFKILDERIYDKPFYVEFSPDQSFRLQFTSAGQNINEVYHWQDTIRHPMFWLCLKPTKYYDPDMRDNKLYFIINSDEALIQYFVKNLNVQPLNLNANTIEISFRDFNAIKARDLVNAIDTIYLNYTRDEKNKANNQKIGFINEQLESTEERLLEFEKYFEDFTIYNRTSDMPGKLDRTITLLDEIDSSVYQLKMQQSKIQTWMDSIKSGSGVLIPLAERPYFPSFILADIEYLNGLILERSILLQSYNSNTQAYKNKSLEIDLSKKNLVSNIQEYKNLVDQQLNLLIKQKNILEREFVTIPSKNTEFTKVNRYYKLYEDFYLSLMQRKAEFQLALAGTVTDFKILSPASYPAYPISPQKWVVFGVAFSLWMVVSFFLIGLFYLLNNKINTLAELEKLVNIPLLGGIPHYSVEKMKESRLVIGKDSNTVISEAFRTIRTNLQFIISKKDSLVISLTSSISGEGKTFVAINLATVLAFSRKKVVLVDLDLRKPRIYKIFNNKGDRGISTILIGIHRLEECIFPSAIENLDYIVGGPIPPNPSELLMSPEFEEFIRALKEKYDIILLDTPPVGLVTDGVLVMKKSDVQLFIMRASYSRKQFLKSLEKLNRIHHFSRLALILNGVKKTPGYDYGYGYGNTSYFDKKRV